MAGLTLMLNRNWNTTVQARTCFYYTYTFDGPTAIDVRIMFFVSYSIIVFFYACTGAGMCK